jgi:ATP-dependent protease ClpP protease subunit
MYSPSLTRGGAKRLLEQSTRYKSGKKFKTPFPIMPPMHGVGVGQEAEDGDSDDESQPFKIPKLFGGDNSHDVYTERNHIFFKTEVSKESVDKLAQEIDHLNHKLATLQRKATLGTFAPKPIYLHITTNGGDLLSGFFAYDKIKASRIPIRTVIEGSVASAGSLMSIAGSHRYMTPNSHLLIHQLRTGMFGTYEELIDEKANCNQFMTKLVSIYHANCNGRLSKTKIREILKRDIFWDTKTAIQNGLVDEEWLSNSEE